MVVDGRDEGRSGSGRRKCVGRWHTCWLLLLDPHFSDFNVWSINGRATASEKFETRMIPVPEGLTACVLALSIYR